MADVLFEEQRLAEIRRLRNIVRAQSDVIERAKKRLQELVNSRSASSNYMNDNELILIIALLNEV